MLKVVRVQVKEQGPQLLRGAAATTPTRTTGSLRTNPRLLLRGARPTPLATPSRASTRWLLIGVTTSGAAR